MRPGDINRHIKNCYAKQRKRRFPRCSPLWAAVGLLSEEGRVPAPPRGFSRFGPAFTGNIGLGLDNEKKAGRNSSPFFAADAARERYLYKMPDFYICDAVEFAANNPQALTAVTKYIYLQIAKQRSTSWKAMERNIRSRVDICWSSEPGKLQQLTGCSVHDKLTSAQFIAILTNHSTS